MDFILFAVWKDSMGRTMAVETGGISMTGGEVANCYAPVFNVGPGTYNVSVFVVAIPDNNPMSLTITLQVSLLGN